MAREWITAAVADRPLVEQEPLRAVILVEDTLADDIRNETAIELRALPLVPSAKADHRWS